MRQKTANSWVVFISRRKPPSTRLLPRSRLLREIQMDRTSEGDELLFDSCIACTLGFAEADESLGCLYFHRLVPASMQDKKKREHV